MGIQQISLDDRFDLSKESVLLNGTQALVRLMLMQKARDRAAGLNTAGYVTGYRGSPLGAVDMQMMRASKCAAGGNSSNIHVDWIIGSGELDIDGITQDGDRVPVMRSGEWAYE